MQPVGRRRRLQREPGQLARELHRIPVHRSEHVKADDLEGNEAEQQRCQPGSTKIDRPDLGVADPAEPADIKGLHLAHPSPASQWNARFRSAATDLHARE